MNEKPYEHIAKPINPFVRDDGYYYDFMNADTVTIAESEDANG